MIAKKKTSKKRMLIYAVIILIMVFANVYIYLSKSSNDEVQLEASLDNLEAMIDQPLVPGDDDNEDSEEADKKNIPDSPLEHYLYLELQKVGDWPVIPRNVGKANPFAPFFSN